MALFRPVDMPQFSGSHPKLHDHKDWNNLNIIPAVAPVLSGADVGTEGKPLTKRVYIETKSRCSHDQLEQITEALERCANIASWAWNATLEKEDLAAEFFKTRDPEAMGNVRSNFLKIHQECKMRKSGKADISLTCYDFSNLCLYDSGESKNLAYARYTDHRIVLCPGFFRLSGTGKGRSARFQDTTMVHEMTHLALNFKDVAYEWTGIQKLSSEETLKNPDTYAIFAQCAAGRC